MTLPVTNHLHRSPRFVMSLAGALLALGCSNGNGGGTGAAPSSTTGTGGASGTSSASHGSTVGTSGATVSSGPGGAATSTTTGTGGATASSGSGGAGMGGAATSSTSGAGGATSSSGGGHGGAGGGGGMGGAGSGIGVVTATSAGTGGAGSSSSSGGCGATDGGTDGGTEGGTEVCSPPGSASPGSTLWSTTFPVPCVGPLGPYYCGPVTQASWQGFGVGTTGHVFSAFSAQGPSNPCDGVGYGPGPMWAAVAALDASGAVLYDQDHGFGTYSPPATSQTAAGFSLGGADGWVLTGQFVNSETGSCNLGGGSVTYGATSARNYALPSDLGLGPPMVGFSDQAANAYFDTNAGLTWQVFGVVGVHAYGKVDPSGASLWYISIPYDAAVQTVEPATGIGYITGPVSGTDDLGCGTIAGSGAFAGAIDTCGNCMWSRAAGTAVSVVPAGGRSYLVGTFQGTLDVGCGTMTSTSAMPYAAAIDASGACVWSRGFPAVKGLAITPFPTGEALITGGLSGSIDVGCGPVAGGGLTTKLDAAGKCVWSGPGVGSPVGLFSTGDIALSAPSTGSVTITRLDGATGATLWSNGLAVLGSPSVSVSVSALDYVVAFGASTVLELDGAGAVRFQSSTAFDQHALDPCGNVLLGSLCAMCSTPTVTVTKLAP